MSGTPMTSTFRVGLPTGNVILAAFFLDTPLELAPELIRIPA